MTQESTPESTPLKIMSAAAQVAIDDQDPRDSLFEEDHDQSYTAPAAPLVTSPVTNGPEAEATRQEALKKTEAIRPLA